MFTAGCRSLRQCSRLRSSRARNTGNSSITMDTTAAASTHCRTVLPRKVCLSSPDNSTLLQSQLEPYLAILRGNLALARQEHPRRLKPRVGQQRALYGYRARLAQCREFIVLHYDTVVRG